jgi:hypothetical protein
MKLIVTLLAIMFFSVSFNAYACLVPLTANSHEMSSTCPSNDEQPARSLCDVFKQLAAQTISSPDPAAHLSFAHPCKEFTVVLSPISSVTRTLSASPKAPHFSQAQSIVNTSILRI